MEVTATEHATYIKSQMPDQPSSWTPYCSRFGPSASATCRASISSSVWAEAKGKLTCVDDPASPLESLIYVVADPTDDLDALKSALERRLRVAKRRPGFEPMTTFS